MGQKTDNQYLDMDSIKEVIETLDVIATLVLFSLSQHGKCVKDTIIRNFIARSIVSLKGILRLYEEKDYCNDPRKSRHIFLNSEEELALLKKLASSEPI